jgi:hypothetical protein
MVIGELMVAFMALVFMVGMGILVRDIVNHGKKRH